MSPHPISNSILQGGLSFALQRQISTTPTGTAPSLSLSMVDMLRALREAHPHFGSGGGGPEASSAWMHPGPGLVVRGFRPEVPLLLQEVMACVRKAAGVVAGGDLAMPPLLTLLLQGPPGAGKVHTYIINSPPFTSLRSPTPN